MNIANIYKPFLPLASLITTIVCSNLITPPAEALILFESSLGIKQTNNFWYKNKFSTEKSNTKILAFNEAQDVTLTRNIGIQESPDNIGNLWDNLNLTKFLDKGMKISSHILYLSKNTSTTGRVNVKADVSFSGRIVGFLGDFRLFKPINDLFAPGALNNGPTTQQSLEGVGGFLTPDIVTLLNPNSIRLNFSQNSGIDPLRVFTVEEIPEPSTFKPEEVPEPLTILGTGLALGMGMILKRKSLKSETEN